MSDIKNPKPQTEIPEIENTVAEAVGEPQTGERDGSSEIDAEEILAEAQDQPAEADADVLEAAQAKTAEYLEGWQRERAQFANYKKRVERERTDTYQNAKLDMIVRILPVIDDFERALANAPEDAQIVEWINGVGLIHRKLQNILEAEDVTEIEALGQPFDPNFHEAVGQEENDTYESGHVGTVLQKGYCHGDRVIRAAIVRVVA